MKIEIFERNEIHKRRKIVAPNCLVNFTHCFLFQWRGKGVENEEEIKSWPVSSSPCIYDTIENRKVGSFFPTVSTLLDLSFIIVECYVGIYVKSGELT